MGSRTELARLVDDCTVQILDAGTRGGSGFFVAPGAVVTCAHVVALPSGGRTADRAVISWRGDSYGGVVRAEPAWRGTVRCGPTPTWP